MGDRGGRECVFNLTVVNWDWLWKEIGGQVLNTQTYMYIHFPDTLLILTLSFCKDTYT